MHSFYLLRRKKFSLMLSALTQGRREVTMEVTARGVGGPAPPAHPARPAHGSTPLDAADDDDAAPATKGSSSPNDANRTTAAPPSSGELAAAGSAAAADGAGGRRTPSSESVPLRAAALAVRGDGEQESVTRGGASDGPSQQVGGQAAGEALDDTLCSEPRRDLLEQRPPPGEGKADAEHRRAALCAELRRVMAGNENKKVAKEGVVTYHLPFSGDSKWLNTLLGNFVRSFTTCLPEAFDPYISSENRAAAVRVGALVQGAAYLGARRAPRPPPAP